MSVADGCVKSVTACVWVHVAGGVWFNVSEGVVFCIVFCGDVYTGPVFGPLEVLEVTHGLALASSPRCARHSVAPLSLARPPSSPSSPSLAGRLVP